MRYRMCVKERDVLDGVCYHVTRPWWSTGQDLALWTRFPGQWMFLELYFYSYKHVM